MRRDRPDWSPDGFKGGLICVAIKVILDEDGCLGGEGRDSERGGTESEVPMEFHNCYRG